MSNGPRKGTPLHVTTTYLKLLRRAMGVAKFDKMVVVFDTETSNSNFELSKDYKANRVIDYSEDGDSPYRHLKYVKKVLDHLNISWLAIPHIEADDIVASVARAFSGRNKSNQVYIFSTDTDFYQLLDRQTFIVRLKNQDDYELVDSKFVKNKLGVTPRRYVEFKSLVGDTADNIKGIQGVGPVTARKIINKEIDFDRSKYEEVLELNKKLITLNCECHKQWKYTSFWAKKNILNSSNKDIFKGCRF